MTSSSSPSSSSDAPQPSSSRGDRHALITGGAGFIGSHLTDMLLDAGCRVTVIDNLSTGRRTNLPAQHERLRFIHADVSDALPDVDETTVDEVYHLAAAVGVRLIIDEPIRCIETNVNETSAVLRFAAGAGPSAAGVPTLIASSSEVYGKAESDLFSEEDDVVYGPTTRSRWSYAATKAIDEYLALAYHERHRLPVVVARFFNTVGPRQVGNYGMVLPNFVSAAIEGKPLRVYGDGRQVRCFCDVRDVTGVLPAVVRDPACAGLVFNIGSDEPVSILELAQLVRATLDSDAPIEMVRYDEAYSAGFEDLRRRRPDLRRLRSATGFRPTIALKETIRDLAAWMRGGVVTRASGIGHPSP